MVYPPTIPPNTRTNDTLTRTGDAHIDDHNQTSDALTSIVGELDDTIADLAALDARSSYTLFDHYANAGNVGTGEDDLYSDTLPAGLLAANGDKAHVFYGGTWASSATASRRMRAYFGGTSILDTTAYVSTFGGTFGINIEIIRVSSSVVRCTTIAAVPALSSLGPLPIFAAIYAEVTGLTLANTQIVKITGEASGTGAATDDIVARQGYGLFIPAA